MDSTARTDLYRYGIRVGHRETSRMSQVSAAINVPRVAQRPGQFHALPGAGRGAWRQPDHSAEKCGKRFFANARIIDLGFWMFASHRGG